MERIRVVDGKTFQVTHIPAEMPSEIKQRDNVQPDYVGTKYMHEHIKNPAIAFKEPTWNSPTSKK